MPIHCQPSPCEEPIVLCKWTVQDIDALSTVVAHVAAGQWLHATRILSGSTAGEPEYSKAVIDKAIRKLDCRGLDSANYYVVHRDGWLFQMLLG
jgi:hypothetical protein